MVSIGGYYSIGLSGPSYGGGTGYMCCACLNGYPLLPMPKAPAEKGKLSPGQLAEPYMEGKASDNGSEQRFRYRRRSGLSDQL